MSPPPHVAVVGAGVSGLRCAEVLLNNGLDVTIIEARDRIGGRVSSPLQELFSCFSCKVLDMSK